MLIIKLYVILNNILLLGITMCIWDEKICNIIDIAKKVTVKIFVVKNNLLYGKSVYLNGTGFLFDYEYILTNYHVVESADQIKVGLYFKNELISVKLVGFDSYSDIAVLKITKLNINLLELNANNLREGQLVLSIGMPYGLEFSSNLSIISSLEHSLKLDNGSIINRVIQIDEKLIPGCSGGPLINMNSEIIGMNTIMFMEDKISFALRIDFVLEIVNNIIDNEGL